jgi:hypothetical protein
VSQTLGRQSERGDSGWFSRRRFGSSPGDARGLGGRGQVWPFGYGYGSLFNLLASGA